MCRYESAARSSSPNPRARIAAPWSGAVPLGALDLFVQWANSQSYLTRPVRIIAGFPAGGGVDIMARLIGQWLSERLGQQFVIENRPGAGSNIGTEAVVHATPDGYTLLLAGVTNTVNATLYEKLNYDFIRDIAPVAGISLKDQVDAAGKHGALALVQGRRGDLGQSRDTAQGNR